MQTYSMEIGGYQNFNINGTLIVGGNSGGFGNSNFPNTFKNLTIGNNSTVVYSYPGNQTIYPTTYNNLTLTGSGTKTTGPLGYVSSVTITNGGSGYDCDAELIFTGGGGSEHKAKHIAQVMIRIQLALQMYTMEEVDIPVRLRLLLADIAEDPVLLLQLT